MGQIKTFADTIMLEFLKNMLAKVNDSEGSNYGIDPQGKLRIATCVILLEAVTADSNISEIENQKIRDLIKKKFAVSDTGVDELINLSKNERQGSIDLWYFTNLINENLEIEEKYNLMEMIWEAIYSDKTLDKFENYIAHKLLNLLNLDHTRFIDIKLKVKDKTFT